MRHSHKKLKFFVVVKVQHPTSRLSLKTGRQGFPTSATIGLVSFAAARAGVTQARSLRDTGPSR